MTASRRQPRIGNRRHVQIYLDEQLHSDICLLAQQQEVSFSRGARELIQLGASQLHSTQTQGIMFTPEQINFIEGLIDKKIQASAAAPPRGKAATTKDYHTVREIRDLIMKHLDEWREFAFGKDFPLAALRFFLRTKVEMRPGDVEIAKNGNGEMRFDAQVGNALSVDHWPECPFIRSSRIGHWKFKDECQ